MNLCIPSLLGLLHLADRAQHKGEISKGHYYIIPLCVYLTLLSMHSRTLAELVINVHTEGALGLGFSSDGVVRTPSLGLGFSSDGVVRTPSLGLGFSSDGVVRTPSLGLGFSSDGVVRTPSLGLGFSSDGVVRTPSLMSNSRELDSHLCQCFLFLDPPPPFLFSPIS